MLARDIDDDDIHFDVVRDALEVALPAPEIGDSRIADWRIGFTDTVADNASGGLFVVGADGRTDLMYELFRSDVIEPRWMIGVDPSSEDLRLGAVKASTSPSC